MAFNCLDSTLPTGISAGSLKLLYQFDGTKDFPPYTPPHTALSDLSGNGVHLTYRSYGYSHYLELFSFTDQDEPIIMQIGGWTTMQSVNTHSGVFNTLGALTLEWIGYCFEYDNNYDHAIFAMGDHDSSTESLNVNLMVWSENSANYPLGIRVRHEYGAGVNEDVVFDWGFPPQMAHMALTRAADGKTYKLYSDGVHLQTQVASNAPTGGTGAIRAFVQCYKIDATENKQATNSLRLCHAEFTAAQIAESYARVHV